MKVRISSPTAPVRQAGEPDRPAGPSRKTAAGTRPGEDSVMGRTARILLTAASLVAILAMPTARAQAPSRPPASATPAPATRPDVSELTGDLPEPLPEATAPEGGWEPQFLKSLPRPPEQPGSLFQPAPAPGPPPPDFERYFELDPLLDPPQW